MLATVTNLSVTGTLINDQSSENSIQEFYDYSDKMNGITIPVLGLWGVYDEITQWVRIICLGAEDQKAIVYFDESNHWPMFYENENEVSVFVNRYK